MSSNPKPQTAAAKPAPAGSNTTKELIKRWISLPLAILIINVAGATINLNNRFEVLSNKASTTV